MGATVSNPRRRKAVRRTEILAAARSIFATRPYEAASISQIAARADCVEGTIYTYFRNKRELFDAVLAEFYDRLIADIAPRFESIRGTRERLAFLIARHLRIALDDPGVALAILRESRGQRLYFGSRLHALNRRYSRFILRTLADGIECGELRADLDVSLARDLVFGGLEHWVWNELGRGRTIDPASAADAIVRTLLDGWRAGAAGATQEGAGRRVGRRHAGAAASGRNR